MNWLRKLLRRPGIDSDIAEEIAFHRAMRAGDPEAPPFGNAVRIRESMRDQWTFEWIENAWLDAVFALRGWGKNPGFALTAIASLAVGIGAATAIFTAADNLLLRPMPYRDPNRLMMVWESNRTIADSAHNVISPANFLDWKARNPVFDDLAAFTEYKTTFAEGERAEQLTIQSVSANFFGLLGVGAYRGRVFNQAEDLASANGDSVILISYRLWQNWFAGDERAIGKRVVLNSKAVTIVGIMPPGFYFRDKQVDLWDGMGLSSAIPYRATRGRYMMAVGRLRHDVPFAQAQARMADLARALETEYPVFNKNWSVTLEPLRDSLVSKFRSSLLALLGAVGLLLAVACANVANLLLARCSSRRGEMAVRVALGAGRGRLIRQMLTESMLIAAIGGGAGIALGRYALAALIALAPRAITQTAAISFDWRILSVALAVCALTGVVFGLAPAVMASRADASPAMNRAGRWGTSRATGARSWLIAGEIAVSVVLLAGASLLFRSLLKLEGTNPGMDSAHVLTYRFSIPAARYKLPQSRTALFERATERIATLPGVSSASGISFLPFDGDAAGTGFTIGGRPPVAPGAEPITIVRTVLPRYFETMGIPLRRGRDFTAVDNKPESPLRFIVNEAFARKYMANEEPLAQTISVEMNHPNPFGEIIGVVGDVDEDAVGKPAVPTVYYVHAHLPYTAITMLVRTDGDPLGLVGPIRKIMHDLDPAQPVADVRTMTSVLAETYGRQQFSAVLFGGFSLVALLLAAIGIYGVLAYSVAERTREIGVRMAIGADGKRIVSMVLTDGARFVLAGLIVGIAGALALSRFIESSLFGVGARDPISFLVTPAVLLVVALIAAYAPARRAARLDPMQALRVE